MSRVKKADGTRITVSSGTKGAISEHIAAAWLLSQGYDVFRNVSPNGRADLLAVDWVKDETIRVDVKSQEYGKAKTSRADQAERRSQNSGFDIRYLVVSDDGSCAWYSEDFDEPSNDNEPKPKWFIDTKTGQRFLMPSFDMSRKEWCYLCHWLLRAYPDFVVPFSESFVRSISARGIGNDSPPINATEFVTLEKLRRHIITKLTDAEAISFIVEAAA